MSSGPGDPRLLRAVDPSIEISEAFLVFFEQSAQCYISTMLYLFTIPWFIKHSKYGQCIVCPPAYYILQLSIEALTSMFAEQVLRRIIPSGLRYRPAITSYGKDGSGVAPLAATHITPN